MRKHVTNNDICRLKPNLFNEFTEMCPCIITFNFILYKLPVCLSIAIPHERLHKSALDIPFLLCTTNNYIHQKATAENKIWLLTIFICKQRSLNRNKLTEAQTLIQFMLFYYNRMLLGISSSYFIQLIDNVYFITYKYIYI